jgi:hypothetical protein
VRTAITRIVAAWFFMGAVAAMLSGMLFVSVPSNQSSTHRLIVFSAALLFAAILLWVGWRLWRSSRFAVPAAIVLLLAQVPAFYGVGATYECAAPFGAYARVFLFSGGNVEYPFFQRAEAPSFLPPIKGYYLEPYAGCGIGFASQDPPLDSPMSFGWISINVPAVFFLLIALALAGSAARMARKKARGAARATGFATELRSASND